MSAALAAIAATTRRTLHTLQHSLPKPSKEQHRHTKAGWSTAQLDDGPNGRFHAHVYIVDVPEYYGPSFTNYEVFFRVGSRKKGFRLSKTMLELEFRHTFTVEHK